LNAQDEGISAKNRSRLRQFDDPRNVEALLKLPNKLVAEVPANGRPSAAQALVVQTAVAIELLLMVPMRRQKLTNLNINEHFSRTRDGVVHLVIPGHQVKNSVPIEAILPAVTVQLLDLYLTRYRPALLSTPSPWLFPGVADRPKSCERMALQISDCIKERLGLLVNVHLFRHFAAMVKLDRHPGDYGSVRFLHGHKQVQTTMRYYCTLEAKSAFKHYDDDIIALRESLPRPSNPRLR
jgi:integrase